MLHDIEYLAIQMVRADLKAFPDCATPEGFQVRRFGRGDFKNLVALWQQVEDHEPITANLLRRSFGNDLDSLKRRCLFLVAPDGRDIGTATAWYERHKRGLNWGRLHWVAISREFQGLGLSRTLVSAAMQLMRSLGHRRAVLATQTPRVAAIRTYLHFGFVPLVNTAEDRRAWKLVRRHLRHPALEAI